MLCLSNIRIDILFKAKLLELIEVYAICYNVILELNDDKIIFYF